MSLFWLHVRGAVGHTFNHKFSSFDFYVLILPTMPHHYCLINLTEVEIQGGFVYGGILQRSLVARSKINTEIKSRVFVFKYIYSGIMTIVSLLMVKEPK